MADENPPPPPFPWPIVKPIILSPKQRERALIRNLIARANYLVEKARRLMRENYPELFEASR